MEYTKKMVLVPEDSLNRYQTTSDDSRKDMIGGNAISPTVQTPGDPVSRLDVEMHRILNSKSPKDQRERWKQFQEMLRKFLFYNNAVSEENDIEASPEEGSPILTTQNTSIPDAHSYSTDAIIKAFPKTFRNKGTSLINHIKTTDIFQRLSWDHQGMVTIDGEKVEGSSIIDLLNDAVRYRKSFTPLGRESFKRFLVTLNTPRDIAANKLYWNTSWKPNVPTKPAIRATAPKSVRRQLFEDEPDNLSEGRGYKRKTYTLPRASQRIRWQRLQD